MSEAFELINNLEFCVFDLETTGGNHKSDKIIEIGLVKIKNFEVIDQKNYLIQPEIKIPEFIQKLTSIKEEDVKDSPVIEDVIDEILKFMGDSILVAHNTSFDVPFFNSVLKRLGKPQLKNKSLCTNLMTKYLIPNLMNSNLNYMSKIFGIKHKKAHRALDDALATAELLLIYLKIYIDKGITKINHLYYPRGRYELDRANFKSDDNIQEIRDKFMSLKTPHIVTIKGENGVILFALPCNNTDSEKELIFSKLEELDWRNLTIKLVGPFIEALINYNSLFNKIDSTDKGEVSRFLWKEHLPEQKPPLKDDIRGENILGNNFGDFIIINNLVPEQYNIYPINALSQKSELVFRYPGHRKKLIQYINSKSNKLSNNKLKKTFFNPLFKQFLDSYILKEAQEGSIFCFKKSLPAKNQENFFKEMEEYLKENPNSYDYPKYYI
ncbi:DNA polymerase III subunit epsilon [Halobacteriovorax marinus]|uniref:DNA polymerase III PolC-type n=1 Tax=Halobacteriovorax marinus (strain ATCC BAA-682 / DSM 15412 / SJ) TaxID=862908 RepID=E1WXI1_HALMS|nr:3'-5' exonuclease [Halobacteriovorax marinus]ATH08799.1 DNA polymerase III subunit epsilon [Halobacteriovorax marinus]CBW27498.1 putative DNA polymerase III PolC-type [Halobacteriovorax marinus SJ]